MLQKPKLRGCGDLKTCVDDIGFTRACQLIDVHESTMRRWLRDSPEPPQAALQALYWLTKWGYGDACSKAHWTHQYNMSKIKHLEERLFRLRAIKGPGCDAEVIPVVPVADWTVMPLGVQAVKVKRITFTQERRSFMAKTVRREPVAA